MKVLISFCNQPKESSNNLLILDVETGEKRYLLETSDSYTGLSQDDNFFYALSQNQETGLVIIDKITEKIVCNSKLDNLLDPHSLVVDGKFIYVVSTGNDQVLKYEFDKDKSTIKFLESVWHPIGSNGEKDTHHVNSIFKKDESIYISAFGEREIEGKSNTAKHGYIENISNNQRIYSDIYHPHSVFVVDNNFYYCGSAEKIVGKNGKCLLQFDNGYIRGLAMDDQYIAVGISNRRKVSKSTGLLNKDISIDDVNESCNLVIFNSKTNERTREFNFFPSHQEIYDIMSCTCDGDKVNEDMLRKELPFDQYGRYEITRKIIDHNRVGNRKKNKILDVGGRYNVLKRFLPNDDVFFLDPYIDSDEENFIKGDGCDLSVGDQSFDWVVSMDVFEHIDKNRRDVFLQESMRVAKEGVILIAPFYSEEVEKSEINVNENYKIFSDGNDHVWLKEHIENGLPIEDEIEKFINDRGYKFQKLYNNRLDLWEILLGMHFLANNNMNDDIKIEIENFNHFYNLNFFPYDSSQLSYRRVYFIKKNESLENIILLDKLAGDSIALDVIKKGLDIIGKIDTQIREKIKQKNIEIEFMKKSKFWKMRGVYIKIKNLFK